jgi:WhiB family redox-sensing transcriptional regulator
MDDWRQKAACLGYPTDWWFPATANEDGWARARAICADCPVRTECLAYAVEVGEVGMWGGLRPEERGHQAALPVSYGDCDVCGRVLVLRRPNIKYCSDTCRRRAWRRNGDTEKRRERYRTDPTFRQQRLDQSARWRERKRAEAS